MQSCIVESGMDQYVAVFISCLITTNNRVLSLSLKLILCSYYFQDVAVKAYSGNHYAEETLLDYKKEVHEQHYTLYHSSCFKEVLQF